MIKAIETIYNGYRFRSRLEARWAVFFDTLGIKYEYEKEGFDLDGTWYLPDFWLPELDCWIEIKSEQPTEAECIKARVLAEGTKNPVFILWGDLQPFWQENIEIMTIEESKQLYEETGEYHPVSKLRYHGTLGHRFSYQDEKVYWSDTFWFFAECPLCEKIGIAFHGFVDDWPCQCIEANRDVLGDGLNYGHNTTRLIAAYTAARQARFEHGESGRR